MAQIIITAKVADSEKWEKGFRTHGNLFNDYTAKAIHFAATDDNEVAIHWEVDDVDKFLALVDSPETAEAMEHDGVNKDTVKIFVLDREVEL